MLVKDNAGVVPGTIVTPDGASASRPTTVLSDADAAIVRAYKKFKQRHGIIEYNHCAKCFERNLHEGMRGHVTDDQILYECRCRMLFYQGQTLT